MKKFRKTIRGTLSLALIGLNVAVLFGVSIVLVVIAQDNIIAAEKKSLSNYAKHYSDQIEAFFQKKQDILQGIADGFVVGEQYSEKERTKTVLRNYKKIRSDDFLNLYYIYPDQTVYRMNDADGARKSYNVEKEQWYQDTVTKKKGIVTAPYLQTLTGNLLVTMSCPVLENHKIVGVLSAEINIQELVDITESATSIGGMYGMLIDQNEDYVVHPDRDFTRKEDQTVSVDASLRAFIEDQKIHKIKDYKNTDVYIKAVPIESCGWTYVMVEETTLLQMTQNKMLTVMISILICACTIILALIYSVLRYQFKPVENLKKFVQQVVPIQEGKTYKNERAQIQNLVERMEEYVISGIKQSRVYAGIIYNNMDEMKKYFHGMLDAMQEFEKKRQQIEADYAQQTVLFHTIKSEHQKAVADMQKISSYAEDGNRHMEQFISKIKENRKPDTPSRLPHRMTFDQNMEQDELIMEVRSTLKMIQAMTEQTSLLALRICVGTTQDTKSEFVTISDEIQNLSEGIKKESEKLVPLWEQIETSSHMLQKLVQEAYDATEKIAQKSYRNMDTGIEISEEILADQKQQKAKILSVKDEVDMSLKKIKQSGRQLLQKNEEWKETMEAYDALFEKNCQDIEKLIHDAEHILDTTEQLRENNEKFHI